tara:strand:- start:1667 stop:2341 length:675 start_codon:yes stop_codon:yes gene_type:complete
MKTLIYCGTNHGVGLKHLIGDPAHHRRGRWDRVYGFEANPHLYSKLKQRYINDRRVKMYNVILSNQHNVETEFYILDANNTQMDYASSVCKLEDFNPKYKEITTNQLTYKEVVRLKTANLYTILQQEGIVEIDLLITDLEGSDLTVLKTLKPLIDSKKINKIKCEVEPDDLPTLYKGLDNKFKGFKELLDKNYTRIGCSQPLVQSGQGNSAHFHIDNVWKMKKT